MKQEKKQIIEKYQEYTDKYFLRSKKILEAERINPIIRYQVFTRKEISNLVGINETVDFIKGVAGDRVKIYSLKEDQNCKPGEPIIKLEGRVQDLVDLETGYLGILSGRLTGEINMYEVRKNAKAIKKAAKDKTIIYFGARHFDPNLDEQIARICYEEGFHGCSTDIGAKSWNSKGGGTIPHALILSYAVYMNLNNIKGNPTLEAAKAFDKHIDQKVPRIVLVDTFNREITDSIEAAKTLPNLAAIRIDTCGENYSEGSREILSEIPELNVSEKYLSGKGVTIAGVWALRKGLDDAGFGNVKVVVSSGFNAEKTTAFTEADKTYQRMHGKTLFDSIGTGSISKSTMATSDIGSYYNEDKGLWISISKTGRREIPTNRLELVE